MLLCFNFPISPDLYPRGPFQNKLISFYDQKVLSESFKINIKFLETNEILISELTQLHYIEILKLIFLFSGLSVFQHNWPHQHSSSVANSHSTLCLRCWWEDKLFGLKDFSSFQRKNHNALQCYDTGVIPLIFILMTPYLCHSIT